MSDMETIQTNFYSMNILSFVRNYLSRVSLERNANIILTSYGFVLRIKCTEFFNSSNKYLDDENVISFSHSVVYIIKREKKKKKKEKIGTKSKLKDVDDDKHNSE